MSAISKTVLKLCESQKPTSDPEKVLDLFEFVPCLSENQEPLYEKAIIDFAMYLTGHDRETVEQMYFDYYKHK